jgi:hypothetical protein
MSPPSIPTPVKYAPKNSTGEENTIRTPAVGSSKVGTIRRNCEPPGVVLKPRVALGGVVSPAVTPPSASELVPISSSVRVLRSRVVEYWIGILSKSMTEDGLPPSDATNASLAASDTGLGSPGPAPGSLPEKVITAPFKETTHKNKTSKGFTKPPGG